MTSKTMARKGGFTLIEVMALLAVLGVIAALVVPKIFGRADDTQVRAARADISALRDALTQYKLDNQAYPTAAQGLNALIEPPQTEPVPTAWRAYLSALPLDPWGRPYQYMNPGVQSEVEVMSWGADGAPGGEGANADIGSTQ